MDDEFNNLSPAQKRVAIAQEVLARLAADKFHARRGWFYLWRSDVPTAGDLNKEMQPVAERATCTVCALGGLFMSAVIKGNNQTLTYSLAGDVASGDACGFSPMINKLKEYFSQDQIILIEMAFERGGGYYAGELDAEQFPEGWEEAQGFGQAWIDDRTRMEAIMRNIIANNGTFLPH